jgi:hypothetical protein
VNKKIRELNEDIKVSAMEVYEISAVLKHNPIDRMKIVDGERSRGERDEKCLYSFSWKI